MDHGQCEKAPGNTGAQTDVSVQVQRLITVVPVADLEECFHGSSGKVFQDRGSYGAEKEGQKDIVTDRNGYEKHDDSPGTIERKEGTTHKAAVDPFFLMKRNVGRFKAPAEKTIDVKKHQPVHGGINFIVHKMTPFE